MQDYAKPSKGSDPTKKTNPQNPGVNVSLEPNPNKHLSTKAEPRNSKKQTRLQPCLLKHVDENNSNVLHNAPPRDSSPISGGSSIGLGCWVVSPTSAQRKSFWSLSPCHHKTHANTTTLHPQRPTHFKPLPTSEPAARFSSPQPPQCWSFQSIPRPPRRPGLVGSSWELLDLASCFSWRLLYLPLLKWP